LYYSFNNDYDKDDEPNNTILINALINRTQLMSDQVDTSYNAAVEQDNYIRHNDHHGDSITIHGVKYCRTINLINSIKLTNQRV
jgi:hypothetical protein